MLKFAACVVSVMCWVLTWRIWTFPNEHSEIAMGVAISLFCVLVAIVLWLEIGFLWYCSLRDRIRFWIWLARSTRSDEQVLQVYRNRTRLHALGFRFDAKARAWSLTTPRPRLLLRTPYPKL